LRSSLVLIEIIFTLSNKTANDKKISTLFLLKN